MDVDVPGKLSAGLVPVGTKDVRNELDIAVLIVFRDMGVELAKLVGVSLFACLTMSAAWIDVKFHCIDQYDVLNSPSLRWHTRRLAGAQQEPLA